MKKLTSRKFLTAILVQIASLIALFWPSAEDQAVAIAQQVGPLLAMAISAVGYGVSESKVDAEREKKAR